MKTSDLKTLIVRWRNDSDAAKHAGRRYEQQRSISFARDCYGQMLTYTRCADELEQLIRRDEAQSVERPEAVQPSDA